MEGRSRRNTSLLPFEGQVEATPTLASFAVRSRIFGSYADVSGVVDDTLESEGVLSWDIC